MTTAIVLIQHYQPMDCFKMLHYALYIDYLAKLDERPKLHYDLDVQHFRGIEGMESFNFFELF